MLKEMRVKKKSLMMEASESETPLVLRSEILDSILS